MNIYLPSCILLCFVQDKVLSRKYPRACQCFIYMLRVYACTCTCTCTCIYYNGGFSVLTMFSFLCILLYAIARVKVAHVVMTENMLDKDELEYIIITHHVAYCSC